MVFDIWDDENSENPPDEDRVGYFSIYQYYYLYIPETNELTIK